MKAEEKELRDTLALKIDGKGRKNYSVKAGAGGGKTTMLSERICNQLISGESIESFAIITYTNAAADELRAKISGKLQAKIAETDPDKKLTDIQLKNALKATNLIDLLQISTIHAFLLKILKEYSFESCVLSDIEILQDDDEKEFKNNFYNEWKSVPENFRKLQLVDFAYQSKDNKKLGRAEDISDTILNDAFLQIADVKEEIVLDDDIDNKVNIFAGNFFSRWYDIVVRFKDILIIKEKPLGNTGSRKGKTTDFVSEMRTVISLVDEIDVNDILDANEKLSEAINNIVAAKKTDSYYRIYGYYNGQIDDELASAMEDVISVYNNCNSNFERDFTGVRYAPATTRAFRLACEIKDEYQKMMLNNNKYITNNGILSRAERLLEDNPEILDKIRTQYTKVYVDEFQDTTATQTIIIKLICGKPSASPEELKEDGLLVVGDPKQSIYRFAGAEVYVYDDMDRLMDQKNDFSEAVLLESNFRSNKDIVEWVNNRYEYLMPGTYSKMDTDWNVKEYQALHGVYRYEYTDSNNEKTEPVQVAKFIKNIVNNEKYFIETVKRQSNGEIDESSRELKAIDYSDIMVLCKKKPEMPKYMEEFEKLGIPVDIQGTIDKKTNLAISNFINLVDYFANSKSILKRKVAVQIIGGIDVTKNDKKTVEKLEKELYAISAFFNEKKMNSAQIAQYILSREDLYVPKGAEQSLVNIRKYRIILNQMVDSCIKNNNGDLSNLVVLLKEYTDKKVERQIVLESNVNAIRFMNAHKSKGLTGQIVIVVNNKDEEKCKYGSFKKSGKYYPSGCYSFMYFPSYCCDNTIVNMLEEEEEKESIRLQYVVATRAAQALIFMPLNNEKVWFAKEEYGIKELPEINIWMKQREADTTNYNVVKNESSENEGTIRLDDLYNNAEKSDKDIIFKKQNLKISPSGLEVAMQTGYSSGEPGYVRENRPKNNIFGLVLHRVFELIFARFDSIKILYEDERNKEIDRIINLAILEQIDALSTTPVKEISEQFTANDLQEICEELCIDDISELEDGLNSETAKTYFDYLTVKVKEYYNKVIVPIMDNADKVYPEFEISMKVDNEELEKFISEFESYSLASSNKVSFEAEEIWINGQADLVVIQKDKSIKVYDYKSDVRNGKGEKEFDESLNKKYEGQLKLYKYCISKIFGVSDVETELIHLYR